MSQTNREEEDDKERCGKEVPLPSEGDTGVERKWGDVG